MSNTTRLKSMILLTSFYGPEQKTFKMMPISNDCPFVECIFNNDHNVLAVIGKEKKATHQMVQKLNDNGEPDFTKQGQPKKQRVTIDLYQEYYLLEREEIHAFIDSIAANADAFDFKKFFKVDDSTNADEATEKLAA